ncbi:MAG: Asp-tRNA(Asn)/Glu-tRNA(Gln) amidotransferase subunit GatC [Polyangiaceae bacterium]
MSSDSSGSPRAEFDAAFTTKLAALASLELSPEEADAIAHDLARIVDYVAELSEVDVGEVSPLVSASDLVLRLREDAPKPELSRELVMTQAPRSQDGAFVVPAFVDEG